MVELTTKEAIEEIQHAMEVNECAAHYTDEMGISRESSELAIEALRKQMPEKAVGMKKHALKDGDKVTLGWCKCEGVVCSAMDYCPNCGQKLDWSEEE